MTIKRYLAAFAAAILACVMSLSAIASEGPDKVKVSGKIIDEAGVPIIGIAVISSDGSNGTITNDAGLFYITVPEGDVLTVTGIGYQDEKVCPRCIARRAMPSVKSAYRASATCF